MELTEENANEVTIVAVAGRLDAAATRQLAEQLTALIGAGRSRLVIDVSRLDYIGSMGLRALLIACGHAAQAQGRLVLCGLTAPVQRVIELGGFGSSLDSYASRAEALAALSAG